MKAKEFIPAEKPRNFVAKNAKMGGAGQHKDKKKAEKQGDLKHKQKLVPMESIKQKLARKIQENLDQNIAEGSNTITPNWAKYVLDQIYKSNGEVTMTDLFDEGIPGLRNMFMDVAQELGLDPDEDFQDVEAEVLDRLESLINSGHQEGIGEGDDSELKRIQSDVWDFYKDVHNVRPRHWTQEQWNDENFLRLQMKQLSDIVNKMSPEEKAEQGWS
jgi:hypothetical protein